LMSDKSMAASAAPLMDDGDKLGDEEALVFDESKYGDDPLLRQLPKELHEYVVTADEHHDKLEYVNRSSCYSGVHSTIAALCCCYSVCRMVVVKQGEIGLTQNADKPELLGPGRHVLLSPFNNFMGIRSVTDNVIVHGTINIIQVQRGSLGYAVNMKTGRPIILSKGKHIINDINFVWKKFITLRDRITNLDQLQIIRIETGSVGYCYVRGNLKILHPGLHLIEPPDRFGDILSTQMQIIDLEEAVHETSDYVPLAIKAAVFFRIVKPERALRRISNIHKQITETAVATLAGIIRSSSLSDIASRSASKTHYHQPQSKDLSEAETNVIISSKQEQKKEQSKAKKANLSIPPSSSADQPSAPDGGGVAFYQHVHDQFMEQLHETVLQEWGISIINIRIESLKINDHSLQQSISNQAIDVSKQHNRYIMLQKQQEIVVVEANARASKQQVETEALAATIRSRSQAQADAIRITAKAEQEALELKGQGEAEYARLLESTKLGNAMSVMRIQADALKDLNQVAYIPHLPQILAEGGGIFGDSAQQKK